jgi:cytoskeleton protein RodZ
LLLKVRETAWVKVADAHGKLLLSRTLQSGEQQTLVGEPPFALFIGNAPGVEVLYRGSPVDLTPFIHANATARLSVPAAPSVSG